MKNHLAVFSVFRGVKGLIVSCETCSISGMNNLAIFGFFKGNIILYLPPSSKIYSSILRRGSIFGLDTPPRWNCFPLRNFKSRLFEGIENATVKKTFAGTDQTTWNRVKLRYFDWPIPVFIRFIEISRWLSEWLLSIICFWFQSKNLKMGVILSGKHLKPTLSIKLRQFSLWADEL